MTDTAKLRDLISRSGLKTIYIAKSLGISYTSLKYKISNKREFKASEISKMQTILGLTADETAAIFFSVNVN